MPADNKSIQNLRESLRGRLILPGDGDYDAARKVFNGMIDKRPALIVRCAGVADVIAAVNFARERDMLAAIRGGSHNVVGQAVCDDGLVIDLSDRPTSSVSTRISSRHPYLLRQKRIRALTTCN